MASRRTPIDKLNQEINKILEEYEDEIEESLLTVVKKISQKGAKALRDESKRKFPKGTGEYARGWKATVEKEKRKANGVIHNAKKPWLAHLLENGHANRGGGRTPPHVHIKPVADAIEKEFTAEVEKIL